MLWGRTWLVAVFVALGALAFEASSASASGVACADCSGTYAGSWSAQTQYTTPEGTQLSSMSLRWTEKLTTPTSGNGASGVWSLVSAQGMVSFTNSGSPSDDCTATLSPNPAMAANVAQFGPQVSEGPSGVAVNAYPPTYWSGAPTQPLVSSDNSHPGCYFTNELAYESGFWTGFSGSSCHYAGPSGAEAMSFPLRTTTTITDNCDGQGSDSFGRTGTATLTSQLTLSAPLPCVAPAGARDPHMAARAVAHAASGGSLTAIVTRRPGGFTGQTTLLAISAGDGRIIATRAPALAVARITLALPGDRYALLADAASPVGRPRNDDGIGPLVTVRVGRRTTVKVVLGRAGADRDAGRSQLARARPASLERRAESPLATAAMASGVIVTVNGINLTLPDGSQISLDNRAVSDLFPVWHDQDGITFVETGKLFTDFAQREQALSDSGRLEQPYHFNPLTPDFTISGDARIDRKRRMTITIELRDRCGGQVISRVTITRRLQGRLGSIRYGADMMAALNEALSRLQPPSATGGCGCA